MPSSLIDRLLLQRAEEQVSGRASLIDSPTRGITMPEEKKCSRPGCTKTLRSDNSKGVCANRSACGGIGPASDDEPTPKKSRAFKDTAKRFRTVTTAFGLDPDELLAEHMQGWLDRVEAAARKTTDTDL